MLSLRELREQLGAVTSESELADLTQATLAPEVHPGVRHGRLIGTILIEDQSVPPWAHPKIHDPARNSASDPPSRDTSRLAPCNLGRLEG